MSNKYHVSLGTFGIYAGTLKNENEWKDKSDVTIEAVDAVAGYLLTNEVETHFTYRGKRYVLSVHELIEGEN